LQPNGLVAFHISNRYLKLDSVLANLAASCALPGYMSVQVMSQAEEKTSLGSSSAWGVVAHNDKDLKKLVEQYPGWRRLNGGKGVNAWTDDYSSLVAYLNM
jgi:hypothetical protein